MWVDRRVHAMEIYFVAMAYEMSDPFGEVPLCCSTTHFNLTLQTSTRKTDEHRTKYDNQTISVFRSFFFLSRVYCVVSDVDEFDSHMANIRRLLHEF